MPDHDAKNPSTGSLKNSISPDFDGRSYLTKKYGDGLFPSTSGPGVTKFKHLYPTLDDLLTDEKQVMAIDALLEKSYKSTQKHLKAFRSDVSHQNFIETAAKAATSRTPLAEKKVVFPEPPKPPERSQVGMARKESIEETVRAAVASAGSPGLDAIKKGQYVLIKPNTVMWMINLQNEKSPTVTNPEVLRAVIKMVKERTGDPDTIYVSECSAFLSWTILQMLLAGHLKVAMEEKVNILPWESSEYVRWTPPVGLAKYFRGGLIPRSMFTFDHFINVPVLKNHQMPGVCADNQCEFTASIKAFVGVLNQADRMDPIINLHFSKHFPETVAELNLCRPDVTMNIVDATDIVLTNGPVMPAMKVASPGIVLASRDRVAVDTMALAILRCYGAFRGVNLPYVTNAIEDSRIIKHATELGLGLSDKNRIDIIPDGIDDNDMNIIKNYWLK